MTLSLFFEGTVSQSRHIALNHCDKTKKASGRLPPGMTIVTQVGRRPDAFWQVRIRIEMTLNGRRLFGDCAGGIL